MERAMAAKAWPVSSQHSLMLREVSRGKECSAVPTSSSVAARPLRSRLSRAHCVEGGRGDLGERNRQLGFGLELSGGCEDEGEDWIQRRRSV